LPRALRRPVSARMLAWADLEVLASEVPGGVLLPDHRRLARLHPADIARVADAVPVRQATEIMGALDLELAADTMEEMIDEKQADVVEQLDPERAADILERMAPDAAADVLAELEPDMAGTVLERMDPVEAADVHALLTYAKNTAGGLMTTDYVIAPPDLPVREAIGYLRPQLEKPDWIYYIYVVSDIRERRLLGVLTLRDLLLADPDAEMRAIMTAKPRRVNPDTPAPRVAQIMSEYNLMALPVTDEHDRLLGIVSVDDALEIILPQSLRRRLPHIFS
jgi:Mg/Co/Ni transporter MgtE